MISQAKAIAVRLGDRVLLWLLVWYVLAFALAHVPYELYQPWIRVLGEGGSELGRWIAGGDRAPIVSGIVMSLSLFGGMLGAMVSLAVARAVRLPTLLLIANAIQLLIVAMLAVWLHPAALALVFFRNFGMNMTHAPLMAAIAPRIGSSERATWLSLQSFAGRLGFSLVMFALSSYVSDSIEWFVLSQTLLITVIVGSVIATVVWATGRALYPSATHETAE